MEQFVGRPSVDHPSRIQSQILGSFAAINLEFELSRRVGIGIDGEQAAISIASFSSLVGGSRRSGRELISTATSKVRQASKTTSASKTDSGRVPRSPSDQPAGAVAEDVGPRVGDAPDHPVRHGLGVGTQLRVHARPPPRPSRPAGSSV